MRINLYRTFINKNEIINSTDSENVYYYLEKSLLAINIEHVEYRDKLENLKQNWKTNDIEIYQKNFLLLLLYSKKLDINIRDVKFEYSDTELEEIIQEYIREKNIDNILDIINEDSLIIEKLMFVLGKSFNTLSGAILEISNNAEIKCYNCTIKESELIEQKPVQLLLGIWYPQGGDII